jgi:hypothetical protein
MPKITLKTVLRGPHQFDAAPALKRENNAVPALTPLWSTNNF